jgi:lauroyl/myristoyl acyltransferase
LPATAIRFACRCCVWRGTGTVICPAVCYHRDVQTEELVRTAPPPVRPPLITFAGLIGFLYAYPLYWMLRRLPRLTLWVVGAGLPPIYRLTHRSDQRFAARRISQWLDLPERQGQALAGLWMDNTIRVIYDRLYLLSGKPVTPSSQVVTGREYLDQALNEGRGVLLLTLHSFGIPAANSLLRELGYSILSVRWFRVPFNYGRIGRGRLEARFEQFAERIFPGAEVVSARDTDNTLRLAQRLRSGGIVHLAADVWSKNSLAVPFLNGGQSVISPGVLHLARLCRCPVLPLTASRTGAALRVELGAPLPFQTEGTAEECTRINLPLLVAELERQVRADPDQWEKWTPRFQ